MALAELDRVRDLVEPIASDLGLDLYDVERRSATVRITLDTPPGSDGGIDLDTLALATRLISREIDHDDPIAGKFTLEVTSPGLERPLRTPWHFQREVGKDVTVRLQDAGHGDRRVDGRLVAADDRTATILTESGEERIVDLINVDKARTVFVWGAKPKPGSGQSGKSGQSAKSGKSGKSGQSAKSGKTAQSVKKEKQRS